jgi:hypothetical protein
VPFANAAHKLPDRLSPHEFFGIAFWLGFSLTLLGAEVWIQHCRVKEGASYHIFVAAGDIHK